MNLNNKTSSEFFRAWQEQVLHCLAELDPQLTVRDDRWQRPTPDNTDGGGGITRVLEGGQVFESGGVNFSEVFGKVEGDLAKAFEGHEGKDFYATGTSIVIHPFSPCVPTVHANFRFMQVGDSSWYGGGMDLTPYTYNEEAFKHFHNCIKNACDKHSADYYPRFKKWCDEYFYLPHRKEARGIGGIFFDYLGREDKQSLPSIFEYVKEMAACFIDAYMPIVSKTTDLNFSDEQKEFQMIRHGRYVEFNLVHDRGTKFGLQSNGRTESILMSLPKTANWAYCSTPKPGSDAALLEQIFREPRSWV